MMTEKLPLKISLCIEVGGKEYRHDLKSGMTIHRDLIRDLQAFSSVKDIPREVATLLVQHLPLLLLEKEKFEQTSTYYDLMDACSDELFDFILDITRDIAEAENW